MDPIDETIESHRIAYQMKSVAKLIDKEVTEELNLILWPIQAIFEWHRFAFLEYWVTKMITNSDAMDLTRG